jgi:hypothetical protein
MSALPGLLDPKAVYLSPLNRRCRYVPVPEWGDEPTIAKIVYADVWVAPGLGGVPDGFLLRRENWRILRRVGTA